MPYYKGVKAMKSQKELIQAMDIVIQATDKLVKEQTETLNKLRRSLSETKKERLSNE
jgi:hypothetical protein